MLSRVENNVDIIFQNNERLQRLAISTKEPRSLTHTHARIHTLARDVAEKGRNVDAPRAVIDGRLCSAVFIPAAVIGFWSLLQTRN